MRLARTLSGVHLLPIHAPTPPDRYLCSPAYGTKIEPFDCRFVVDTYWPTGKTPIHYYLTKPVPSSGIGLPIISRAVSWDSSCQVSIEPAGPAYRYPDYLSYSPEMMRGLAGYVIQKCAVEEGGIGGFVTIGLRAAELYLEGWADSRDQNGKNNVTKDYSPPDGVYLTITVSGKNQTRFAPGDTDPIIAGYLSRYAAMSSQLYNEQLNTWLAMAQFMRDRALGMLRASPTGGLRVWWDGTGLERYTGQNGQYFGSGGADPHRQGSGPDSGHSDGTLVGSGPWKNIDAGSDQQPQSGSPSDNDDGKNDEQGAADGDGEMTYLCDTSSSQSSVPVAKGAAPAVVGPDPVDCEKLSWSGLPGSSNPKALLTLEAPQPSPSSNASSTGEPLTFTYGSCTLAVFATNPQPAMPPSPSSTANPTNRNITISWAHVLAAFETLTNLCVVNPLYPKKSRGGLAFWSQQGQGVESWIHGKKGKRGLRRERQSGDETDLGMRYRREDRERRRTSIDARRQKDPAIATSSRLARRDGVDGVDGMMALPKGVNITLFRTGAETVPQVLAGALHCEASEGSEQGQRGNNSSVCAGGI